MTCRICLEDDLPFVHPCKCKGSSGNVHHECLAKWIEESNSKSCEICHQEYLLKDTIDWNPNRCCQHFLSFQINRDNYRIGITLLGLFCIYLSVITPTAMVIASCISTIVILVLVIPIVLRHEYTQAVNCLFIWKGYFSIPYAILVSSTLVYTKVDRNILYNIWSYDLQIFFWIFIIRSLVILYLHMRSLKFQDWVESGESGGPLLA